MSARKAVRPKQRKRQKRERPAALPFVQSQETLAAEHIKLTGEGYSLCPLLFIRINRRAMKANVEVRWKKLEPEIGPKAYRLFSHYLTIDLRKHVR